MSRVWDVIVIGAGPAGLTAAQAVASAGLSCLCLEKLAPGGALINHGALHDCPDLAEGTMGPDLAATLADGAMGAGVEIGFGEATSLTPGDPWTVSADEEHQARAVIVATGLAPGKLGIAGEEAFEGMGLTHCAACDGPLYVGKPVYVAGDGKWAMQDAIDLAANCSAVALVCDGGMAAIPADWQERLSASNVAVIGGHVAALHGDGGLAQIELETAEGRERVDAHAVFVQTRRRAATDLVEAAKDAEGRLIVDARGASALPGLFAAGDATAGQPEQIGAALDSARRAAAGALAFLRSQRTVAA